jgi:hypothetical protein
VANLTKIRREKTQIRNAKEEITINTTKSKKSSETTLRTYILINFQIVRKWRDFYILMTIQN